MLANRTRLIAHGSCAKNTHNCNGFHVSAAGTSSTRNVGVALPPAMPGMRARANPITEGLICQKHSDDGGKTWSKIRVALTGVYTGQIVWDDVRNVLIIHYSTVAAPAGPVSSLGGLCI